MESSQRRTQAIASHLLEANGTVGLETVATNAAKKNELVQIQIDSSNGVARLTMNSPPVNALSNDLLEALMKAFEEVNKNASVKAIVLTGKGKFSGGADISGFTKASKSQMQQFIKRNNQFLINIENGNKPVVAAIDGFALGGGLELAMGCHSRVCTPTTSMGLPELNLGVIPGFGGTQRLPRLIGVQRAVEMMLTSASIRAKEAKELGLVDDIVPANELLNAATQRALQMAKDQQSQSSNNWQRSLRLTEKVDKDFAQQVIGFARQKVAKVAKNVPHPLSCLNAIEEGIINGPEKGLEKESEEFVNLIGTPTTQALIHFFFATKMTNKVPGVTDKGLKPRDIKKAAVIGGGTMGSGIVTALILSGITCYLKEVNQQFLDAGIGRVKDNLQSRVKGGKMTEQQFEKVMSLMKPTLDYSNFKECDIVIEAVIEDVPLKQKVFLELEQHTSPHCILASNTSTINIDLIGQKTRAHDRIIGTHFFSPAHVMPLLEIIRTKEVSPQVIVDTLGLAAKLRKTPIVVGNCIGFTANRIFAPYCQAAMFLIERGVDMYKIDQIIESFGMPMGPFKVNDLSGLDVFAYVGNIIANAYPDRVYKTTLGERLVKAKRLGQKSGQGFYKYEGRKAVPDPEGLAPFLAESRKDAGSPADITVSDSDIVGMIFYPVVNESCRVLEEKMVVRASDIDISSVFGYGFPAYRGGIMKWGEQEGFQKIASKMEQWYKQYNHPIFKPSAMLLKLASNPKALHQQ